MDGGEAVEWLAVGMRERRDTQDHLQRLLQSSLHPRYAERSATVHAPADAVLPAAICGSPFSVHS
jgi:hypothetical protein